MNMNHLPVVPLVQVTEYDPKTDASILEVGGHYHTVVAHVVVVSDREWQVACDRELGILTHVKMLVMKERSSVASLAENASHVAHHHVLLESVIVTSSEKSHMPITKGVCRCWECFDD